MIIPRILPRSQHVRVNQGRFTRIINRSNTSIPARTINQVVNLVRNVHASYRQPGKSMAEYVRGECAWAAVIIGQLARQEVDGVLDHSTLRGIQIPGSPGMWMNLVGLHHVANLTFKKFEMVVDVTAAQIRGRRMFENCEALVIITEPNDEAFTQALQETYHNSQWMVTMFWL